MIELSVEIINIYKKDAFHTREKYIYGDDMIIGHLQ